MTTPVLGSGGPGGQDNETSWVRRLLKKEAYSPEYQQLKFSLHRKLLDRVNLEAVSSLPSEQVKEQMRSRGMSDEQIESIIKRRLAESTPNRKK